MRKIFRYMGLGGSGSWRNRVQLVAGWGHSLKAVLSPACLLVGTAPETNFFLVIFCKRVN